MNSDLKTIYKNKIKKLMQLKDVMNEYIQYEDFSIREREMLKRMIITINNRIQKIENEFYKLDRMFKNDINDSL